MDFYIVLGESGFPLNNHLWTKQDIEALKSHPGSENYSIVPINVPWANSVWSRVGGQGISAYPAGMEITTMRVPKQIAYETQKYAVWLARTINDENAE